MPRHDISPADPTANPGMMADTLLQGQYFDSRLQSDEPGPGSYPFWHAGGGPRQALHQVYNFEVEGTHTYIAGGIRVHNTSMFDFIKDDLEAGATLVEYSEDFSIVRDPEFGTLISRKFRTEDTLEYVRTLVTDNTQIKIVYTASTDTPDALTIESAEIADIDANGIASTFGSALNGLGSALGSFIVGDNLFARVGVDTVVGTVSQNIAEAIGVYIDDPQIPAKHRISFEGTNLVEEALSDFGFELVENFTRSATSTFSSLLLLEAADALGLEGFGGDLFQAIGGTVTSHITNALLDSIFSSGSGAPTFIDGLSFNGFGMALSGAVGALAGRYIANQLVTADSEAEAIGQQIGSAIGSFAGPIVATSLATSVVSAAPATATAIGLATTTTTATTTTVTLSAAGNVIVPGIGALIGVVIGTVLGNVIGGLFDDGPKAVTAVGSLDATHNQFGLVDVLDGGLSPVIARKVIGEFAGTANAVINDIGGRVVEEEALRFKLSMFDRKPHSLTIDDLQDGNSVTIISQDVGELAAVGTAVILYNTEFADGDLAMIAAFEAWKENLLAAAQQTGQAGVLTGSSGQVTDASVFQYGMAELISGFTAVADYELFSSRNEDGENSQAIAALMQVDPTSAFSVGWAISLLRFEEIGLYDGVIHRADGRDNKLIGTMNADVIYGEAGNDHLLSKRGDNVLYGGAGDDTLVAEDGDDTMFGGDGVDAFSAGTGNAVIDGGADEDLITFAGAMDRYRITDHDGNEIGLGAAVPGNEIVVTHIARGDRVEISNVEFVRFSDVVRTFDPAYENFAFGTNANDILNGTNLRDAINGLAGDDVLFGHDGADFLSGDLGSDTLFGGRGDDYLFGVLGNDVLYGGANDDALYGGGDGDVVWGDSDNDSVYGGGGDDVVNGNEGNDIVIGDGGDDLIEGADGNDSLDGWNGDDDLFGGNGIDQIRGGLDDDSLFGGADNDVLGGGWGDDVIFGGTGSDSLFGGVLWIYDSTERGGGDDIIYGGVSGDSIFGGWGSDVAYGGDGNDKIFALRHATVSNPFKYSPNTMAAANYFKEWGQDTAYGGAGNDIISLNSTVGGAVYGGNGNDYVYLRNEATNARVDGGSGYDQIRIYGTNFVDIIWWKDTTTGEVGGEVWYRGAPAAERLAYITDVEEVVVANRKVLKQGYTFNNGYGNAKHYNAKFTGYRDLSTASFQAKFNEDKQYVAYGSDKIALGWQTLTSGHDTLDIAIPGAQRLRGGNGDDSISAGEGDDLIQGENGDDTILGGNGRDRLWGQEGDDSIDGGSGADQVYGGNGNDRLHGEDHDDTLWGHDGNDQIDGGGGDDTAYGGAGDDYLGAGRDGDNRAYRDGGRDSYYGGDGNDTLDGGDSPDLLSGGNGDDHLIGGDGSDQLNGNAGNDFARGGLGRDEIRGGAGNDTIRGEDATDMLFGGDGEDRVEGGTGGDAAYGGDGNDAIFGGLASAGDDEDDLYGGNGNDIIRAGRSNDNVFGGAGNDYLLGQDGNDAIYGGDGNDRLTGGTGADLLNGGLGVDTADYIYAATGVFVELATGIANRNEATGDRLVSIENIYGSHFDDVLVGDAAANMFRGFRGDDSISGGAGDDNLNGEDGGDLIYGGEGNDRVDGDDDDDRLFGGDDNDSLLGGGGDDLAYGEGGDDKLWGHADNDSIIGGEGNDTAWGGDGDDAVFGETGNDRLSGNDGQDDVYGGAGDDIAFGGDGDDIVQGEAGNDSVYGGAGDDVVSGGLGNDRLFGEDGADVLIGGLGNDRYWGGNGDDTFIGASGNDTFDGGDGRDTVSYASALSGLRADLEFGDDNTGDATGDVYVAIENIMGSDFDDHLFGDNAAANTVSGGDGKDRLHGRAGDDVLYGGDEDDVLFGGSGHDSVFGNDGADILFGSRGTDVLFGGETVGEIDMFRFHEGDGQDVIADFELGVDQIEFINRFVGFADLQITQVGADAQVSYGTLGDVLTLSNVEAASLVSEDFGEETSKPGIVDGTDGDDRMVTTYIDPEGDQIGDTDDVVRGFAGNDYMNLARGSDLAYGGDGDDQIIGVRGGNTLYGGAGNDTLYSGHDTSTLYGGDGDDHLIGATGKGGDHVLTGGAGADLFDFGAENLTRLVEATVTDFDASEDRLMVGGVEIDLSKVTNLPDGFTSHYLADGTVVLGFGDNDTISFINPLL